MPQLLSLHAIQPAHHSQGPCPLQLESPHAAAESPSTATDTHASPNEEGQTAVMQQHSMFRKRLRSSRVMFAWC